MPPPLTARVLFPITAFSSAFLIFFVQPLVGKSILPWFGGAPAVWILCLAFYQFALFAGYAYAHWLAGWGRSKRAPIIHFALFAAALLVLPVLPGPSWKPVGGAPPSLDILSMLAANVGLPFLLLAATAPLLQVWFARALPGRSPYGLYAVSNFGSLLALASYPFVVEPWLPLSAQSRVWSGLFAACGVAVLACAWLAGRSQPAPSETGKSRGAASPMSLGIDRPRVALWIALPACAVVLLMGITNELCLDVASVPFLWIGPLATYLVTFIVCFGFERLYWRGPFAVLTLVSAGILVWARLGALVSLKLGDGAAPVAVIAALYLAALFFSCMILHGELYRLRPSADRLTAYYMCVSGGGALGGGLVAIAAPRVFPDYYELPLGWAAALILFTLACLQSPGELFAARAVRRVVAVGVLPCLVILGLSGARAMDRLNDAGRGPDPDPKLLYQKRTFFGILRVIDILQGDLAQRHRLLKHGSTNHGVQLRRPDYIRAPVGYYGAFTGIGMVMGQRSAAPLHVGIVGLGAGVLAAYGIEGDRFHFYEIDPDVIQLARDSGYFSYLADSRASIEITPGDARLSLETQLREDGPSAFDLLILDAFSSDSIPIHLLTQEALELYLQHLEPGGVLAIHVSNINLELAPLVFRLAAELELHAIQIENGPFPRRFHDCSEWMVLSRDADYLDFFPPLAERLRQMLRINQRGLAVYYPDAESVREVPHWTDDYSDLYSAIKTVRWENLWLKMASIQIEGASTTATCLVDGFDMGRPFSGDEPKPLVVRRGDHVIEVREGDRVVLREEISLKSGEVKTLRVPEGDRS
jgi:hypothetical protein